MLQSLLVGRGDKAARWQNPLEDITVLAARPKMFEGEPRKEEGIKTMPFIMKDGTSIRTR